MLRGPFEPLALGGPRERVRPAPGVRVHEEESPLLPLQRPQQTDQEDVLHHVREVARVILVPVIQSAGSVAAAAPLARCLRLALPAGNAWLCSSA